MLAIIKREISSYFNSAIGYVVITAYLIFGGFYFYITCLAQNSSNLSYMFSNLFIITLFIVPILTMRLLSEEKKQKTDQLLLTSPVSLVSIILGKYLAALFIFMICISVTIVYTITISFFTRPNYPLIFGNLLGIFLLSSATISIGMFLSSVTENQIVAAISGFATCIFILLLDTISNYIPLEFLSKLFSDLSFMSHYNNFTLGIIKLSDFVFFLSVCIIFNFLTIRVFEKKRWA